MRLSKVPKIIPFGRSAPAPSEDRVWSELVPRLLDPDVLAIIHSLLREARPLTMPELASTMKATQDQIRDHCEAMDRKGVLEVTALVPKASGGGEEPAYFFRTPTQAE